MRIAVVSDTHMAHGAVTIPEADVLVHAGDFCGRGTLVELEAFAAFFRALPHRHKILIAGNHDWLVRPTTLWRGSVSFPTSETLNTR